jgi:hypothetical protein
MTPTTRLTCTFVLVVLLALQSMAAQNAPPRLVADNRTSYVVELYRWNGARWDFVRRIAPRTWQQFPNAPANSVWRATFGGAVREHRVAYTWNRDYNGYQDVWLIH